MHTTTPQDLNGNTEQQTAEQLDTEIWTRANEFRQSRRYTQFAGFLQEELEAWFSSVFNRDLSKIADAETRLTLATELEEATAAAKKAIDAIYDERYLQAVDVMKAFNALLAQYLPRCPLCDEVYEPTEDWLLETLVFGEGHLPCKCPERGWYGDEEKDGRPTPKLIAEVNECLQRLSFRGAILHLPLPFGGIENRAIEILSVETDGITVMQFVLVQENLRLRPGIITSRQMLSETGRSVMTDHWSPTYTAVQQEYISRLERATGNGNVLKLYLRFDPARHGWHSYGIVRGQEVRYQAHASHDDKVTEGWWYCQVVKDVGVREGDNDHLIMIHPIAEVPNKYSPDAQVRRGA